MQFEWVQKLIVLMTTGFSLRLNLWGCSIQVSNVLLSDEVFDNVLLFVSSMLNRDWPFLMCPRWGCLRRFSSSANSVMKEPISCAVRFIFITVPKIFRQWELHFVSCLRETVGSLKSQTLAWLCAAAAPRASVDTSAWRRRKSPGRARL